MSQTNPPANPPIGWIIEVPEVHYSRRFVSIEEAATPAEALLVAENAGGVTLDGLEYSHTLENNWRVMPATEQDAAEAADAG